MWPNKVPENKLPEPEVKPPDKTIAEQIAEGLKPFGESFEQFRGTLEQRLAKLEEQTRKPEPAERPADAGQPVSVLDDENVAFAQRLTPLLARQLEVESRLVRQDIREEYRKAGYGDLWTAHEKKINEILDKSALVTADGKPFRGDPQYVRNVVDMVFGQAAREAGMRFDGKGKGFFLETGSTGEPTMPSAEADGLTEAQRKLLGKMGVPLDKGREVAKKMTFVS